MAETRHGYLVLADISGYTGFLAQVELEHAHEILTDLLEAIVENFKLVLTISKLEGDAVFANVDEELVTRPESLLELIENTYVTFRRRRDSSKRATTCDCRACSSMQTLELKFFLHHGDYIVQSISGIRELVGSDVNLIHRLTKNHITETTGWTAYALFTRAAAEAIHVGDEDMHAQDEAYEHLGSVQTLSFDLMPRYDAIVDAQRVLVNADEADMLFSHEFDAPQPQVWDWLMDIHNRNKTMGEMGVWTIISRQAGNRSGVGSVNHCAHGKGISRETIVDWRPFDYATAETVNGMIQFRESIVLTPIDEGKRTCVESRLKILKPWPQGFIKFMMQREFAKHDSYDDWFRRIDGLIEAQNVERMHAQAA